MERKLRFIVRDIASELELIRLLGLMKLDDPDARSELILKVDAIFDEFNPMFDEDGNPCGGPATVLQPDQVAFDVLAKSTEPGVAQRLLKYLRADGDMVDAIYYPQSM